jgi:hypothetical protein
MLATVLHPTSLKKEVSVHVTYAFALDYAQKRFDIEVVRSEDDLEQHLLVDGDEFLIPLADVSGAFAGLVLALISIGRGQRLATVVLAVLKNLVVKLIEFRTAFHG